MTLGNWGQIIQGIAGFGNPYLRDYAHASKIFRSDSYAKAPKLKFLFHTYFDINLSAYAPDENYGLLVKDVQLPSYTMQTSQYNQYNRKRVIQSKIKYEPVSIAFHDDNKNTIAKLWNAYYLYHYNDGAKPQSVFGTGRNVAATNSSNTAPSVSEYNARNIYDTSITGNDDWGFSGGQTNPQSGKKDPFFKKIMIFGFNQHNFIAYALINPIIINFSHDTYSYSEANGTMQNKMTIDYETVVYGEGALDGRHPSEIVTGFGMQADYDTELSPITPTGANGAILGQGGVVDGAGGYIRPMNPNADRLQSTASQASYNSTANPNLKTSDPTALNAMQQQSAQTAPVFRNSMFDIPCPSSTPGNLGIANAPTIGALTSPPSVTDTVNAGKQVTGSASTGFPVDAPFGKSTWT